MVLEDIASAASNSDPVFLGKGKSSTVTLVHINGNEVARKTFIGHFFANLINTLTTGAPVPYGWNIDADLSAYYGRRILKSFCPYWFEDIDISNALGFGWDEKQKAYYLDTEFVEGKSPSLNTPFSEYKEFEKVGDAAKRFKQKLIESGFYGKVWQTDNLTAISNFKIQGSKVVCIDMESGGAQFPWQALINPLKFITYYLPMSIYFNRPLYDDVDINRLKEYVGENSSGLEAILHKEGMELLQSDISALEEHQKIWKSLRRAESGIEFALKKEKITEEEAEWYRHHTNRWTMMIAGGLAWKGAESLFVKAPKRAYKWLTTRDYADAAKKGWRFASSLEYRTETARNFEEKRIRKWEEKGEISREEADFLRTQLQSEKILGYLPDFGVHSAIFVASKATYIAPALYALHVIDEQAGIAFLSGGSIARFTYTLARLIENAIKGKEKPYTAAILSPITVFGNLAYPIQILRSGNEDEKKFAEFVITDFFTAIGRRIPIYGGENTSTEHFFNRIPTHSKRVFNAIKYNNNFWSNAELGAKILFSAYAR